MKDLDKGNKIFNMEISRDRGRGKVNLSKK